MSAGLIALSGLIAANFVYQAITGEGNWSAAVERSFFQGMAVVVVLLVQRGSNA